MYGTLFGVGVGPGAADLLTLRAVRVLATVDTILAAASTRNESSLALTIAKEHVRPGIPLVRLDFPMIRDNAVRRSAWKKAAETTLSILASGKSAAFLTIGDPLLYSTFGYLMRTVEDLAPDCPIEIVSGITSFQAAAARSKTVLCEDEETLHIIPGIKREEDLVAALEKADTAVIVKTYRNMDAIRKALVRSGRSEQCIVASLVERSGERLAKGLTHVEGIPPYMSLIVSPHPKR